MSIEEEEVIEEVSVQNKPIYKPSTSRTISIENLSNENLRNLPFLPNLDDNIISTAGFFLSQFAIVKKLKNEDGTIIQKKTRWYASIIKTLRMRDIKILTVDYEHFTDWVNIYHGKIHKIVEKYGFTYPNVNLDNLDEFEMFDLQVYMYSKKLLEYLEGSKAADFIRIMEKGVYEVLKSEFDIDLRIDTQALSLYKDLQISIINFPLEKNIHEMNSNLSNRACVIKGNLVSYDSTRRIQVLTSYWSCNNCGHEFSMNGKSRPIKCKECGEKAGFEHLIEKDINKDYINIKIQQRLHSDDSQIGVTDMVVKIEGNSLISHFFKKMKPAANLNILGIIDLYEDKTNKNKDELLIQHKAITVEVENENSQISYNDRLLHEIIPSVDPSHIEEHVAKMIRSVAPHLYKLDTIKYALLLQCVDAEPRIHGDSHARVRGNINILLVGDSGVGKSDLGMFVLKILPQSIRTIGGSSTTTKAALTTSVDLINGIRVVTFGVLALCDKRGIAIIDELDKRTKEDFEILSIPMDDNQTIPTHKSGFHQDVMARCPVLLIGNPNKNNGKWDPTKRIDEQTNFAQWLTSRCDLIFVMTDDNDMKRKQEMLEHISKSRTKMVIEQDFEKEAKSKANSDFSLEKIEMDIKNNDFSGVYDVEYIRHELHYLKENYKPVIKPGSIQEKKLHKKWLELSQISMPSIIGEDEDNGRNNPMMDNRKINSLERLAMASARLRRHHIVMDEDIDTAIDIMMVSIASLMPHNPAGSDKLQHEDAFTKMVKAMNSREADKLVSTINSDWIKDRNKIALSYRKMLTQFNRVLFKVGFYSCSECKGKGYVNSAVCIVCKGMGDIPKTFTKLDLERPVVTGENPTGKPIMTEKLFRNWFETYFNKGMIKSVQGNTLYKVGINRIDDVDITNFVESVSSVLADAEMNKRKQEIMGNDYVMDTPKRVISE